MVFGVTLTLGTATVVGDVGAGVVGAEVTGGRVVGARVTGARVAGGCVAGGCVAGAAVETTGSSVVVVDSVEVGWSTGSVVDEVVARSVEVVEGAVVVVVGSASTVVASTSTGSSSPDNSKYPFTPKTRATITTPSNRLISYAGNTIAPAPTCVPLPAYVQYGMRGRKAKGQGVESPVFSPVR